ncbi:hypothetical protein [Enterovibrio norvegicus]|uniref:Uncharacterized protein n=1 Tax=Enterovibrio norvegicus TaxID=188144 RepID=A0A2N7LI33_9GAMM|nr:hypothetical protein [Enterovibrio norvegicus]PMN95275.1 hypothetical protein BCT23_01140 [Enterovibrio norvegicus]
MIVNFNMLKDSISWNASIHQLNSDVLLRHVLVTGNVSERGIHFSYCEKTCKGNITNSEDQVIGTFTTFF